MDAAPAESEWHTPEEMWASVDVGSSQQPARLRRVPQTYAAVCAREIRRERRMFNVDPCILSAPLLVFFLCAIGGIGGALVMASEEASSRRAAAQGVLAAAANALTTGLIASAAPAVAFSGVIRANPSWDTVAPLFRRVGAELAADVRASAAVITFVLAPQAVVREIAPPGLPGWAPVVGLNLLANATWRPGALAAIAHRNELVATGPQQLRAGPIGVVVRYSLWIDGAREGETWGAPGGAAHECGAACHAAASPDLSPDSHTPAAVASSFWGFVQLNLDWARLLSLSGTAETLCSTYAARIEYIRPGTQTPEIVFACGGGDTFGDGSETVATRVIALHNTWTLRAGPKGGSWVPGWRIPLTGAILVASTVLAALLHSTLLRRALYTALLHSILPARVVKKLVLGDTYVECAPSGLATVLFVDIVGYTIFAAARSPAAVIAVLSDLYHAFDMLALRHGCFKVETVGDAFLVVTGLEAGDTAEAAAARAAAFALDLVALVPRLHLGPAGERVRVRVGIASGPLVAGVVGFRTPHFCVFGDTVNTAARMESHGEAGRIHLAPSTAALLELTGCFEIAPRGEIEVKGKGRLSTMWLVGQRQDGDERARCGDGKAVDGSGAAGELRSPLHEHAPALAPQANGGTSLPRAVASASKTGGLTAVKLDATSLSAQQSSSTSGPDSSICPPSSAVPEDGSGLRLRKQLPGTRTTERPHDWDLVALMRGDDADGEGEEPYDLRLFR